MNQDLERITERITARSRPTREAYLKRTRQNMQKKPIRNALGCSGFAHGVAACSTSEKQRLKEGQTPNLGIVSAYNDVLSAHQPYETYPEMIRRCAESLGATAQMAGGVPAMCDGVTQGEVGMELSLFSRDVIALGTAIALSHNLFDAGLFLGICDKIVPGLVMGALSFGHLPAIFVPAGPMRSGLSNEDKARIRQQFAKGEASRDALLEAEMAAYHSPGTCTFYGTANSNQMLMEVMGLHLPGASFVNPDEPLRAAFTRLAVKRALAITFDKEAFTPIAEILTEKTFVNGVVALLATGGSTNHTIHLVAMARVAGIILRWEDFADLSKIIPLTARVYPNGGADVNAFRDSGGLQFLIHDLLEAGLLHNDVQTVWGKGLDDYAAQPVLEKDAISWPERAKTSKNEAILRSSRAPFEASGGLTRVTGNLGTGIAKLSAVQPRFRTIEAPIRVFSDQSALQTAFKNGELNQDFIAVVRFQGPKANGMPELHKLTPPLAVLQDAGYRVALITDGRMSGASGKVLSVIHTSPEAAEGGPLTRLRDGDVVSIDVVAGFMNVKVNDAEWQAREPAPYDPAAAAFGTGRDLFTTFRASVTSAEEGCCALFPA